jgi:hypothetical protein
MTVIREVVCTKCRKKQVTDVPELLRADLFWRTCEFCGRYGLQVLVRQKLTLREWMEAFYCTMGLRVMEVEAFLKKR